MNKPIKSFLSLFTLTTIRSKLQGVIIIICLISIVLTGLMSYNSAKQALEESIYDQLLTLRTRQKESLVAYVDTLKLQIKALSEIKLFITAFKEFDEAYHLLKNQPFSEEQNQELIQFYTDEVLPKLSNISEGVPQVSSYYPEENVARYLQYYYIANNPYPLENKWMLNLASDGSVYSQVHNKYHPAFRRFLDIFEHFTDLFFIDADTGDIIYSATKRIDFATNVKIGVYANTGLGKIVNKLLKARDSNYQIFIDFENYRPSFDAPKAFVGATVFDNNKLLGLLVAKVPYTNLNQIMTLNQKWEDVGLNETEESFLVGDDYLLRSEPRLFIENPDKYFEKLSQLNYSENRLNRIRKLKTPMLQQQVKTEVVEKALNGQSGTELTRDFRGVKVLSSYELLQFDTFRWALITQMDEAEAFAPIYHLNRTLILTTAIILIIMTLVTNWLSQVFTSPIRRLSQATKRVAQGETNVKIKIKRNDEFGDLAESFNIMAQNLDTQEQRLQEKLRENERLLLNILPPAAVEKFQAGNLNFADIYTDISLVYAEVEGFSGLIAKIEPEKSVKLLNEFVGAFDEIAEKHGVEKLRSIGASYIAVCGLSIPRVDHIKRSVDFAIELINLVSKFNIKHQTKIDLDVGIHSGSLIGGIVGKSRFIYEIWGDAMRICYAIHGSEAINVINVTEPVYQALKEIYQFKPVEAIFIKGIGTISVWQLQFPNYQQLSEKETDK